MKVPLRQPLLDVLMSSQTCVAEELVPCQVKVTSALPLLQTWD